jgi:hypothetical protein
MRVAPLRSDIGHIYLDDVENASQRNFSSEPVGQSRYFDLPTDAGIASMLASVAFVTLLGTNASTFNTTGSNATKLNIKASASASYTQITVTSGAAQTAAQVVADLNAGFSSNGLPFLARVSGTHVAIDSTVGGPNAFIELSASSPSTAALQTVLGLTAGSAVSGLTVAALKNAVYVGVNAVAGQTGSAASIATAGPYGVNGTTVALLTGLTGMTAAMVGQCITVSGATSAVNNGTFLITGYVSSTSVYAANKDAIADASNGSLTWTQYANLSVNVSAATINALSTFTNLSTAQQTALDNAVANLIAPSLVETGPVLLSFVYGKLGLLSSTAFQPGFPNVTTETRLGYPPGPAVACVEADGVTPYTV